MNQLSPYLKLSDEVQTALQEQLPIVALEIDGHCAWFALPG